MDLLTIFLRTIFIYFVVFAVMRLMGKREIGKLSVFDLVISIMIAEIAVFVLEDIKKPMIEGLLPMATLVMVQTLIAYILLKNRRLRLWFDGTPSILIRNGKLDRKEMKSQKYSIDDLMLQLRENKIKNVADVEFAFLEATGKLTVFEKNEQDKNSNAQEIDTKLNKQTKSKIKYEGLPLLLIMDGKVEEENLAKIGQNRFWLKKTIQEHGVSSFNEVFFCSIDHKGKIYLDKK